MRVRYETTSQEPRERVVALVGPPNVGKSATFNGLTGRYVTVSNYPGTTVEIAEGRARIDGVDLRILDTPGMHSLLPISEEERVARAILVLRAPEAVVQVADAKSLERTLALTLALLELGLPVVLALNMADEAERLSIHIDAVGLGRDLGVPVVRTAATTRRGLPELGRAILGAAPPRDTAPVRYEADIEQAIGEIGRHLPPSLAGAKRGLALLLLQRDEETLAAVRARGAAAGDAIAEIVSSLAARSPAPMAYRIALRRHERARELGRSHARRPETHRRGFGDRLSGWTIRPLTGIPILCAVVYFGLYRFVGVFGAGQVVDLLENRIFGAWVNPRVNAWLEWLLPGGSAISTWGRELVGGEYGVVTLGVTYAMAIVLPIVSLFFLFFSVLEDSGYFPRLALLLDRVFKRIGLNGRAIIPLALGLGCDTMATMVTRIQETRRERLITTLLLALAVPCSAQYGVVTALLAGRTEGVLGLSYAWLAWAALMLGMFVLGGVLFSRLIRGRQPAFYMELPPLRLPRLNNVAAKTLARMKWYFVEVLPLFVVASVFIWLGRLTHAFDAALAVLRPVVRLIGLPTEAAPAFLYGFFRRDFGAAGLYRLAERGLLDGRQLLVACVTLTLFLPCVAQLLIMKKERGFRVAALTSLGVVCTAFVVGGVVNQALLATGARP